MIYNKITLAFPEEEEKIFLRKYFSDSIHHYRVAFVLVIILYGIFGFLDFKMFPEYASYFLRIRFLFVIPVLSIVLLLSFTKVFIRIWQELTLISFIVGGFGITLMTSSEPENYAYYAGMMLIFMSGYLFANMRFLMATIGGWITIIIYNLTAVFYGHASNLALVNTNFFFISANLIGMFAAYNMEFQKRRNYFLNQNLDREKLSVVELNKNLEITIAERTSELIKTKEKAEEISAILTAIIEGTNENIWAFNEKYELLYINQMFKKEYYQTFGIQLEHGMSLIESIPGELRSHWEIRYKRVLANEQFTEEDVIDTKEGKVYIQIGFNPIVRNGDVVGGSCFGSNITSRKLAEMELIKAKERAEESDRLKSAFLANMSHEIRTPMNGILGFSRLLQEPHLSDEKQQKYVQIIEKSGVRMLNILNDIIDISKIEAGLMEVDIEESNVHEQLEYIYTFFKPEAERKGLQMVFINQSSSKQLTIETDREKLYAVLSNLVKNAIKYTKTGIIEFGYKDQGNQFEFYIKDTGVGIPKNRQEAIFERFIQSDISANSNQDGAGLGLSISKAFLEMLGGKIWVESEFGIGSTFYFNLPYHYEHRKEIAIKNNIMDTTDQPMESKVAGLKVLIAEDDEASEELLKIYLQDISRVIITTAAGDEAVEICQNNSDIELILMDMQMPVMNGYEASRKIRQFNQDVIIIAQTAYGLEDDREKAIAAGCDDYISKPIDEAKLLALIHKLMKKRLD